MALFTATRAQILTYILGVCPFSIAFLVFLNSSVSFVVTDLIGLHDGVGDAVGNLGFADELVALVACPFWGLLSDRIGVRNVCVLGYAIVCLALVLFVQASNVYPQLLLGRLFFSVGGAAVSTMVTAVLPTMSYVDGSVAGDATTTASQAANSHGQTPSITSELTITPARFRTSGEPSISKNPGPSETHDSSVSTSRIAGLVGSCTGLGALIALFVFLPLPARIQKHDVDPGRALQYSYYVVAAVALIVSLSCFIGLRRLKSERGKGLRVLFRKDTLSSRDLDKKSSAMQMLKRLAQALVISFKHSDIAIGYIGGFVARASSVAISLFIPLLVNDMFTTSGICAAPIDEGSPIGLPDIKRRCPRAYIVASMLTGVSQLVALVAAPLFGYWSAYTSRKTLPLAAAAVAGIIGYPVFVTRFSPDDGDKAARAVAFVAVCLIGLSQIGAIVCSLASLSTGILQGAKISDHSVSVRDHENEPTAQPAGHLEGQPLLPPAQQTTSLTSLSGFYSGIYSFFGGAAILILTKAGGSLFDTVSRGAPFYIMAAFNGALLVATMIVGSVKLFQV